MVGAKARGPRLTRSHSRQSNGRGWRPRALGKCTQWSADEVAEHLLDRMPAIVTGLARRTPWAGIDRETCDELYLSAAATVSRLSAAGERPDWRTPRHLERAVIAAFRHEALAHWKTVNAQKRRGDREAAPFDPERDAPADDPLNRLFEPDPREELVARDWLAQLRGEVREFWEPVVLDGIEYKEAGDRLGVDKARRQALYRDGIEHLTRFRRLLEEGRVCQLRAPAIAAYRAGTADPVTAERARAHLASCLPCALVHEAGASALERGILHALPVAAVGRAVAWVREIPLGRAAETAGAGGAMLFGKGVAVVVCAGTVAAGVCATEFGVLPNPLDRGAPHHESRASSSREPRSTPVADVAAVPSTTTQANDLAASAAPASSASPPSAEPTTAGSGETRQQAEPRTSADAQRLDPFAAEFDFEGAAPSDADAEQQRSERRPRASAARRHEPRHRRTARARTAATKPSQQATEFDPEAQNLGGTGSASTSTASAAGTTASAPVASAASSGASGTTSGGSSQAAAPSTASASSTKEFVQP